MLVSLDRVITRDILNHLGIGAYIGKRRAYIVGDISDQVETKIIDL